jgi:ADP-ribose pyrophosphatase YjhB (NUDIX family)
MSGLLARMWRRRHGPGQWYVLWIFHAKFMIGVTGLVRDRDGRVLLLRHRMGPSGRQWGLPTGYARKRERFEDTVVREVKEETGLDVTVGEHQERVQASPRSSLRRRAGWRGSHTRFLRDPRGAVVRARRASARCPGRTSNHDRKECRLVYPQNGSTEGAAQ